MKNKSSRIAQTILILLAIYLILAMFTDVFARKRRSFENLQLGQSVKEVNHLFPPDRYVRVEIPRVDGGRVLIVTSRGGPFREGGFSKEQKDYFSKLERPITQTKDIAYLYGEIIISLNPENVIDGFSWDGEGAQVGTCRGRVDNGEVPLDTRNLPFL